MRFLKHGRHLLAVFFTALIVSGCVSVPVNKIPEPSPSAKLRVFVLPVSGPRIRGYWAVPEGEYARRAYAMVGRFLQDTGIYEVIPESDVEKALGKRQIYAWEWKSGDWALAREVGRAVHADYVWIAEREDSGLLYYRMFLMNMESGKQYSAGSNVARHSDWSKMTEEANAIVRASYWEIFKVAKSDLFETALHRGRIMEKQGPEPRKAPGQPAVKPVQDKPVAPEAASEIKQPAPVEIAKAAPDKKSKQVKKKPPQKKTEEQPAQGKPASAKAEPVAPAPEAPVVSAPAKAAPVPAPKAPGVFAPAKKEPDAGKVKLIVYDFNTVKHMEVVSLILADALREELFNIGPFVLVNRENMTQAVDELKLQYSGLVDEKQAVRIGDWLAANEMVTGRLSALGQVYILSATRTDISTLRALGMGSIKCSVGKEEDLLTGIPEIARKLAGAR